MNARNALSLLLALLIAACPAVCGAAQCTDDASDPCCADAERCPEGPSEPAPCPDDGAACICAGAVPAGEPRGGVDWGHAGLVLPPPPPAFPGGLVFAPDPPPPHPPRGPTAWGGLATRAHWLASLQVFLT